MKIVRLLLLAVVLPLSLVLASCATMSKEECVAADWQVVGEADGAAGYEPQSRFAAHAKSCDRAGIVPDQTLWHQGYQKGLVRYCTPLTGLSEGQRGRTYYNVCPAGSSEGFLRGYRIGRAVHDQRQEVQSLDSRIAGLETQIDGIEAKIAAGEIKAREGDGEIRRIVHEIRRTRYDRERAERDLRAAERDAELFALDPGMILPPRGRYRY